MPPDFEYESRAPATELDYIHRTAGDAEIYFVANRGTNPFTAQCTFRVADRAPELWDAVSGERQFAVAYEQRAGRTTLPLAFAPCGSVFVVFREPAARHPATATSNQHTWTTLGELSGAWTVAFDPKWGGPMAAKFETLVSWPSRPEPGIKFYSGTATYQKAFTVPDSRLKPPGARLFVNLGAVRELAEVKVNGQTCGITWAPPFRVDITDAVKPGANELAIEVVNFWPNRIIGDAALPRDQRRTRTNIRKLTQETRLMESGLLGPVSLEVQSL